MKLLELVGCEVWAVSNGQDAVNQSEQWQPDLIWLDLRMPVLDGYQAAQQIKTQPQPPIIIALTANAFEEDRSKALASGCDDYVRKPYKESIIWEKLAEHLGVQYLYAEIQNDESCIDDFGLTAAILLAISSPWLQKLHAAVIELNSNQVDQLLTEIPKEHRRLKLAISELVQQFRYDVLMNLTQMALEDQPS